jgi:hypothetical protein
MVDAKANIGPKVVDPKFYFCIQFMTGRTFTSRDEMMVWGWGEA